jgi:hypothetical protein
MENGQKPAFPDPMRGAEQSIINQSPHHEAQGMTLREYYAGLALQGVLAGGLFTSTVEAPIMAVEYADALLKALEQNQPQKAS